MSKEGPLLKWTNVVHGWQFRYFLLTDEALFYYTSKEKMAKGVQRGCIGMRSAVVGIDGVNSCQFTISTDGKTYHFQGRDERERNAWVNALESSIRSGLSNRTASNAPQILKSHIKHAQIHLKHIEAQIVKMEEEKSSLSEVDQKTVDDLLLSSRKLMEVIGRSSSLLSVAYDKIEGTNLIKEDKTEDEEINKNTNITEHESYYKWRQLAGESNEEDDYDFIYDNNGDEKDVGDLQSQHGSVIIHLLSQVSIGMDLTKVTLPTFILERRSLLEMYADFFAHPDSFTHTTTLVNPEERFISVVRYYLSAFYAARKSGLAKKPYNPVIGEFFRCKYALEGSKPTGKVTTDGPFPGSDINELTFIAEQVSHHPPVSAFYAEHPSGRISLSAQIYTKSSFLGLSIGVANIGTGHVILHEFGDEEYMITFPSGYGRSIMSTPWIELGGKVKVVCEKTGYYADIEFLTKPFFGGRAHRVSGSIYKEGRKKAVMNIRGEWNNVVYAKMTTEGANEVIFCDVKAEKESKKICTPVMKQEPNESRRLWRHVTSGLFHDKIAVATAAKHEIEETQRREAKERAEKGKTWTPTYFVFDKQSGRWMYKHGLSRKVL